MGIKEILAAKAAKAAAEQAAREATTLPTVEPISEQSISEQPTAKAEEQPTATETVVAVATDVAEKPIVQEAAPSVSADTGKTLTNLQRLLAAKAARMQAPAPIVTKPAQAETPKAVEAPQVEEKSAALPAMLANIKAEDITPAAFSIEVFDTNGASLGWYAYAELKERAEKLHRLAKISPKHAKQAVLFEEALVLFEERLEDWKERKLAEQNAPAVAETAPILAEVTQDALNERQQMAVDMALSGKSFVLIGAAGTGKTTCQREVARALWHQGKLKDINFSSKSNQPLHGPSFAAVAFTRRASGNLRRAIHKDEEMKAAFANNIMTIHALLEYEPVYFTDENGKDTMRFQPRRTSANPLELTHLVVEEASMVGAYDLWAALYDALPAGVQIIFIGDINQLPPVFGPSILNYALVQLPVIELNHVYRQAGDSGILENAHRILRGEMVKEAADVHIIQGKNPQHVSQEVTSSAFYKAFQIWHEQGVYDPETDIILTPYNEQPLGTKNMNCLIAQFLGERRHAIVYEIIAGFNKHYLAVGDRVMYEKRDAVIKRIVPNMQYAGKATQAPSESLSRFGFHIGKKASSLDEMDTTGGYADFTLETLIEDEVRKISASHLVDIEIEDTKEIITLSAAGDFGPQTFQLGYVLTTHKAQGCEWRTVFIIYHPAQRTMIFREWLYTAWTRASKNLYVLGKAWLLEKAIKNPRIKGNTIEDKIAYFNKDVGSLQANVFAYKQ